MLLNKGVDPAGLGPKITQVGQRHNSPQVLNGVQFRLQPLTRVHLDARPHEQAVMELGDARSVYIFSIIAVFVLAVACVNFVNLTTARSLVRAREVGLRKTIGAGRGKIIRQFFGESFLLDCAALLLALGLVRLLLPAFSRLAGRTMSLNLLRLDFHYVKDRFSGEGLDFELKRLEEEAKTSKASRLFRTGAKASMVFVRAGDISVMLGPGGGIAYAIAIRNLKISQGMSVKDAEAYAYKALVKETESAQQSAREDETSNVQRDPIYRLIATYRTAQTAVVKKIMNGFKVLDS